MRQELNGILKKCKKQKMYLLVSTLEYLTNKLQGS